LTVPCAESDTAIRGGDIELEIEGIEHTQKVSELGVRFTRSNSYTHFRSRPLAVQAGPG